MLTRDQQRLLGAAGSGLAASGLLDQVRQRETFEGGTSAAQSNCWISYNRKAIWLEDHSAFGAALRAAGTDVSALPPFKPDVLVKATWAEVAAHGAALPSILRQELETLRRTESETNRGWSEFSSARGGWPWRRRFDTDAEHAAAQAEWDEAYGKHLNVLRDVWDCTKVAIARALPLIDDEEPVDLLELLDQQPMPTLTPPSAATTLQAAALRPTARDTKTPPEAGLFTVDSPELGARR